MKYAFIEAQKASFRLEGMCRVLEVSRSGFYDWKGRQGVTAPRKKRQQEIDACVATTFTASKQRSGAPRLTVELKKDGIHADRKTIADSMQRQNLRAKAAAKFKATTNSNHGLPVAPNLLDRDFSATDINQKYVGDITYLWTDEGWLYLAVFIDLFSRKVVGWSISERMTSELVCDALHMAMMTRGNPCGVIVHTDRGAQYCSRKFQDLLNGRQLRSSMSRKGNCWDNAVAESFFHSMKVEEIYGNRFETREIMRRTIFEYIEVYYNRQRLHTANGYLSPSAFEAEKVA